MGGTDALLLKHLSLKVSSQTVVGAWVIMDNGSIHKGEKLEL